MTKKVAAKTTTRGTTGSSPRNRRPNGKRSRGSKNDQRATRPRSSKKIRKNGQNQLSFSPPSMSLTPNAIQSMVTGVELLDRRDDSFESPSKATAKKMDESTTSSACQTELILRLRLDVQPESVSMKKIETPGSLEEQPALFGTLGDGKSSIRVMLFNPDGLWSRRLVPAKLPSSEEQEAPKDWIIKVHGYATTEKFWHLKYKIYPILCLTSISIIETAARETKSYRSPLGKPLFSNSGSDGGFSPATMNFKAQAGTIGKFLKERGPFLTNEELAGSSGAVDQWFDATTTATKTTSAANEDDGSDCTASTPLSRSQNFKKVHECLSRHSAMLTLQQSSSSPPSSPTNAASENATPSSPRGDNDSSTIQQQQLSPTASTLESKRPAQHAWELYDGALREFRTSQMDRQKASLGTNAGRESAERAEMVVERHKIALELALKEEGPLTVELLVSCMELVYTLCAALF